MFIYPFTLGSQKLGVKICKKEKLKMCHCPSTYGLHCIPAAPRVCVCMCVRARVFLCYNNPVLAVGLFLGSTSQPTSPTVLPSPTAAGRLARSVSDSQTETGTTPLSHSVWGIGPRHFVTGCTNIPQSLSNQACASPLEPPSTVFKRSSSSSSSCC